MRPLDALNAIDAILKSQGGPYIGPKGGKWADPMHKVHWTPPKPGGANSDQEAQADVGYNLANPYYTAGNAAVAALPEDQKEAIGTYMSYGFLFANEGLRNGSELDVDSAAMVVKVDAALASAGARLKQSVNLYRGMGNDSPAYKLAAAGKLGAGSIMSDDSYLSTTTLKSVAEGFVRTSKGGAVIKIHAKKGAAALSVTSLAAHHGERETLIPRGAKLRVRSVTPIDGGRFQIDVDLL